MHIAQWFQQAYMFLLLINCHMLKTNVAYMLLGMYPSFVLVKLCHTISTVCFFWQPKRRNVMQQIASFTHAPLKFLCPGLMFSNYSCEIKQKMHNSWAIKPSSVCYIFNTLIFLGNCFVKIQHLKYLHWDLQSIMVAIVNDNRR